MNVCVKFHFSYLIKVQDHWHCYARSTAAVSQMPMREKQTEKGKIILPSSSERLLNKLTHGTRFPVVISSLLPVSIIRSDVSAASQGASLTSSSLVAASFSPDSSCPIEKSMYHTVQYSCVDIMRSNWGDWQPFSPNDLPLYLRQTAVALSCRKSSRNEVGS